MFQVVHQCLLAYNVIQVLLRAGGFIMTTLANVSLRLPVDLIERIESLAKLTGRSRTFYMQEAIKQKLEDLEDIYLAEQALIDIRSGKSRLYTLDEVGKELGLDN